MNSPRKLRLVFDTNILLSAFLFGGNPGTLFEDARAGKIRLLSSPAILAEFALILRSKFAWEEEDIRDVLRVVGRHSELVKPKLNLHVLEDDADNRVLECAVEGCADFVISGDHHLLDLRAFRNIPIRRASEFLAGRP